MTRKSTMKGKQNKNGKIGADLKRRVRESRETFWQELRRLKRERTIKYMHTMDGEPAVFDGFQIAVGCSPIVLVGSLKQIHKDQRATLRWRKGQGFNMTFCYGWKKVIV